MVRTKRGNQNKYLKFDLNGKEDEKEMGTMYRRDSKGERNRIKNTH